MIGIPSALALIMVLVSVVSAVTLCFCNGIILPIFFSIERPSTSKKYKRKNIITILAMILAVLFNKRGNIAAILPASCFAVSPVNSS